MSGPWQRMQKKSDMVAMTDTLLEASGVTKIYPGGRVGCRNVSFRLYPGEVLGIVGESGSGKSTLLYLAAGLDKPDSGQIIVDGYDTTGYASGDWNLRPTSHASVRTWNASCSSAPCRLSTRGAGDSHYVGPGRDGDRRPGAA